VKTKNSALRQWHGPLTEDLVLRPADFGLGHVPARLKPDATLRSVCGFCSTGCSLDIHLRNGEAVNLSPTRDYPVNLGMACPKGWEALAPLSTADRATTPLIREGKELRRASWDEAMRQFTSKFKELMERHGPESVAFLSTGQICTEEMALLGALFKFGMGGIHCDSNTRQCMATTHVAYKQSFGFDAPPFCYADFEESDVLVFIGSNLCIAHPIMWQRVMRNRKRPKIIVVDPRRTETAMNATQHLALRPGSDLTLLYGIANLLAQNGWVDRGFIERSTTGYPAFAEFLRQFTPDKVAADTGLTVRELFHFAEAIQRGKAVSFWWTMGVNQSHEATRTAQAIINLALMTGNIGRPGTGANSITGQCNAMGSRLFANITGLPAGRDFLNADHRAEAARLLDFPVERIPARNSWAYDEIVQGIADGKIKGLWVIATNSAHSWIDQNRFNALAGRLEFLVVQDLYHTTDTARHAHLILPAAGWGEKEGTLINSERRIGVVKRVARAPGEALSDFNIFRLVAHAWGCGEMFREWSSPEAVFQILKRLSAGRPCDITGIRDYVMIDEQGGIQWPFEEVSGARCEMPGEVSGARCEVSGGGAGGARVSCASAVTENSDVSRASPDTSHLTPRTSFDAERRLFEDGRFFHGDGKARFIFEAPRPMPESTDEEFPFTLLTGRGTSAQWHTGTRTEKSGVLRKMSPEDVYVEINPRDAEQLAISPNGKVRVSSRRGTLKATAFVTPTVQRGQVFIPMHYAATNRLTLAVFDPYSRQPAYKACAVKVERISR
jgi:assimilatory nitrate reductase catalytic subunit